MASELVKQESGGELTLLDVIARAARDPNVDVAKMERLVALRQQIAKDEAEVSFKRDMAAIQSELPVILKSTKGHNFMYARLEDIDRATQPLLTRYGFSVSYDSELTDRGVVWRCTVSHREGHERTYSVPPLPADKTGSKNDVQAIFSAGSYGQRYAFCMAFKIVPRGMDDNGASTSFITDEQAMRLSDMLNDAEIRPGSARLKKFLEWAEADKVAHIQAFRYEACVQMLRQAAAKKEGAQ